MVDSPGDQPSGGRQGPRIRLPVYVNTALNRVRRERQRLVQELGRDPTEQELADALEMGVERLHELEAAPGTPISPELPSARMRSRSWVTF